MDAKTQTTIDGLAIEHLRDLRGEWPQQVLDLLRRLYAAANIPPPAELAPDWTPPRPIYYAATITANSPIHTWPSAHYVYTIGAEQEDAKQLREED
jgi:hypothetical protein